MNPTDSGDPLTFFWNNSEVVIKWLFSETLRLNMYEFCIKNSKGNVVFC